MKKLLRLSTIFCFYTLISSVVFAQSSNVSIGGWREHPPYLKAIEVKGRIGVLYSNKDYGCEWDYDFKNKRFLSEDNTKFGVNIIVYAMNS